LEGWEIEKVLSVDVAEFRARWKGALGSFFVLRPFRKKALLKALAPLRKDRSFPAVGSIEAFFDRAQRYQLCQKRWEKSGEQARPLLGLVWNNGNPAAGTLEAAAAWQSTFIQRLNALGGTDVTVLGELRRAVTALVDAGVDLTSSSSEFRQEVEEFDLAARAFLDSWDRTRATLDLDTGSWRDLEMPQAALGLCQQLRGSSRQLQSWCYFVALRQALLDFGLGPLAELAAAGREGERLPEIFELAYADASLRQLLQEDPILRDFYGDTHSQRIEDFRALDRRLLSMAAKVVAAAVAARRPQTLTPGEKPVDFGEIGVLNHELTRRARHKPVRQLLHGIPNVLPRLKPCLLMSPLSVAQYLEPDHPPFDVVVFDEASQIPVSDAIGAIARGTQLIVAGDPRQLPPTTFFQRGGSDDAEEPADAGDSSGTLSDAESILEECKDAQLPVVHLRWHYRSRHESLIAFSNHYYYENNLLTHPEPFADERGVLWKPVDGVYDRSGSRTNRAEAEAVVNAIMRHYKDPTLAATSIGVVTFNSNQQRLVEDLLDEARGRDLELDNLLSADRDEPLFVKNLENVQGDERDIIVFSVTYGPDASNSVYHNFGPLNQVGGERRLNVAITRARKQIQVFSVLRPEMIDLSRTRALGARHLKSYLEYAARGPSSLPARAVDSQIDAYDSEFERKVATALRSQGWAVHTQVGCSSYRLDLAVVHPEHPGRYVIGIECDGATYHSAATARDRDRLRQRILENLGWRIHRIWSTDWLRDEKRERHRLFTTVAEAIANFAISDGPPTSMRPTETSAMQTAPVPSPKRDVVARTQPVAASTPSSAGVAYSITTLRPCSLSGLDPYASIDAARFRTAIFTVIEEEGPISHTLLCSRVAAAVGMERNTAKLQDRVAELALVGTTRTRSGDAMFFWARCSKPEGYVSFRTHEQGAVDRRSLSDISPQEQANAMVHLIRTYFEVPTEDLLRQTSILFGYSSLTSAARDALQPGLRLLSRREDVVKIDGSWKMR
jgi:very-short-patch-repair endonuclease